MRKIEEIFYMVNQKTLMENGRKKRKIRGAIHEFHYLTNIENKKIKKKKKKATSVIPDST